MAGIFFAFSNFVMQALARIPAAQGMRAMQAINRTVLNRLFLSLFLGTALLCLLLALVALLCWSGTLSPLLLGGSALYLLGNFVVTAACNVPRNEALARIDAAAPDAAAHWRTYLREWTRWNHVRTVTALAAAAAFTLVLCWK